MTRPSLLWIFFVHVLAACAVEPVVEPPATRADGATPDALTPDAVASDTHAPDVSVPDVTAPDRATPDVPPPPPPPCSARTFARLEAGSAYEPGPALMLTAAEDRVQGGCTAWYGGNDATARFVAPRTGTWTFSAVGDELWSFSARTPCADLGGEQHCARFLDRYGPMAFTRPLQFTRTMQAGEALDLIADGCPRVSRGACQWTLRAQLQEPPRGCMDIERPCLAGQRCDSWRGTCITEIRNEPTSTAELVTAVAVRVGGTLRFLVTFRDPGVNGGAGNIELRLRDANGELITPAEGFSDHEGRPVFMAGNAIVLGGSYRRHGPGVYPGESIVREPAGSPARSAEFTFAGATRRVPIEALDVLPDGARCDIRGMFDVCAEGSACNTSSVCARLVAPTLLSASAWRTGATPRSALVVRWEDPNGDVDTLEYTPVGRDLGMAVTLQARDGTSRTTWDRDAFGGASQVRGRVRDRSGRWSEALTVPVSAPEVLAEGWVCDSAETFSRCAEGTICTRYGDPLQCTSRCDSNPFVSSWCEERRCVSPVRACPVGVVTERLTLARDGSVTHEGSGEGAPRVQGIPCDQGSIGAYPTRVYSFRAESAGRYAFSATLRGGPWYNLRIYLRRYCAFGDRGVEQPPRFDTTTQDQTITTALERDEEVYLFVYSVPVIAGTPVGGYRLTVQRSEP